MVSNCDFYLYFLMIVMFSIFICLLTICLSSFMQCLLSLLSIIRVVFLLFSCRRSLYSFFLKSVCFYIYLYSFETSSSNVLKYFLPDCALILISYECPLMRIFILMRFRLINFRWCLYLDSVLSLIHFSKLCPETLLHLFVISSAQLLSYVRLFVAPWAIAHQAPLSMKFSGQEYWSGCHVLLLGIFPIQESNPSLQHLLH